MPFGTSNVALDSRDGLGSELLGEKSGELIGEAGSYKGERNESKEGTGNFLGIVWTRPWKKRNMDFFFLTKKM